MEATEKMRLLCAILLLVLSVPAPALASRRCPGTCRCFTNKDVELTVTVDCSNLGLLEIPYPLPNRTSHLDASGNHIQYVRSIDFSTRDTYLKTLQLQNNDLLEIQSRAFKRLPNLETLILSDNNRLGANREVRSDIFYNLRRLKKLEMRNTGVRGLPAGLLEPLRELLDIDLSFNDLTEISPGNFADLSRLKEIRLSNNFISTSQLSSFSNLPSLVALDLSSNNLQTVANRSFVRLPRLRVLNLTGNPLDCGCFVAYLHGYLTRRRLESPLCHSPPEVAGRSLLSLELQDLCMAPVVQLELEVPVLVLTDGSTLELVCNATGVPPPTIRWSFEGRSLASDNMRVVTTEDSLFVAEVGMSDSGRYRCSASSVAGVSSATGQVLVLEEMDSTNRTAVLRQDSLLPCGNSSLPPATPTIWSFEGSEVDLASGRFAVVEGGGLLVKGVGLEDDGVYMCEVGGQVQFNISLVITVLPEVISITDDCSRPGVLLIRVDLLELILTCVVLGVPPPQVTWVGPQVTMVTTSTEMMGRLVQANATLSSPSSGLAGNYTCIGTNELGVASRSVQVEEQSGISVSMATLPTLIHRAGETAVWNCPSEAPSVLWLYDSSLLTASDEISFACSNMETIIIRDLSLEEDAGQYRCFSTNPSFTLSGILILTEIPEIVRSCPTPTVSALRGTGVVLECPARGTPLVEWQWTRMGVAITGGGRVSLLADGEQLSLDPVDQSDEGIYMCIVSNSVGSQMFSDSYTIRLDVQAPPLAPYFTYRPHSITALVGSTAMLSCGGGGNPLPSVSWLRLSGSSGLRYVGEPEEVELDQRVSVSSNFLLFSEVRLEDEGFYQCVLNSSLGERQSKFILFNILMSPVAMVTPTQLEVELGRTVVVECKGVGDPLPDMRWLLLPTMTVLPSPDHPNYVVNGSDLLVSADSVEDSRRFRCWVANAGGQVLMDVSLSVIAPPATSVLPSNIVTKEGCQATFRCLDGGFPPKEFLWTKEGVPLQNSSEVWVGGDGELTLFQLTQADSGLYTCTVVGTYKNTSQSANLTVLDPFLPPALPLSRPLITSPTPSTLVVAEGDVAQLICLVGGVPTPRVVWTKDGVAIGEGPGVEVLEGGALFISAVEISDQGSYSCWAGNSLGNDSETFSLVVAVPPEIVLVPDSVQVQEGSILNLVCMATGEPRPHVSWFLNDSLILEDGRRQVDQATGSLSLKDVRASTDGGVYSCLASNVAGADQTSFPVDILSETNMRPVLLPMASAVMEGFYVVLDCLVDGVPVPRVSWTRDSQLVPPCPGPRVCTESNGTLIYLRSAGVEDAGTYSCLVEGLHRRTYTVSVSVDPRDVAPFFTEYPAHQFIVNGSTTTLNCVADGSPAPNITWRLDGQDVNLVFPGIELHENGSLTISNADSSSTGFYTCVASNELAVSEVTVFVGVEFTGTSGEVGGSDPPKLTSSPVGHVLINSHQPASLDCAASGSPAPSISWTRDGRLMEFSPQLHVAGNGSLVFSSAQESDEGKYSCKAQNSQGVHYIEFMVRVLRQLSLNSAPAVPPGKVAMTVMQENDVILHCDLPGTSNVSDVVWRRGSEGVCGEGVAVTSNRSLVLTGVGAWHADMYQCLAFLAQGGVSESSRKLSVLPRKEPPCFLVAPKDVHVVKTGFLMLPCLATSPGGVETRTQWFYDHTPLATLGEKHAVLKNGSLLLSNIYPAQAGNYSCRASNQYGVSIVTAHIMVSRSEVDKFVPVRENNMLELPCPLGKGPGVQWVRDGRKSVTTRGDGVLRISRMSQREEAEFTCSLADESFNFFIILQAPPKILTSSGTLQVLLGGVASLDCIATGKPTPLVSWYYGGVQLVKGDRSSILASGTLVLYMVEEDAGGIYTCRAKNPQGRVNVTHLLTVAT